MNPQDLMKQLAFPSKGDIFGVKRKPISRDVEVHEGGATTAIKTVSFQDNSYSGSLFRCVASDALRVIGEYVINEYSRLDPDKKKIFRRDQFIFEEISDEVLEALEVEK